MTAPLELGRAQILAHRRRVGALDERLPKTDDAVRRATWAGLTDSTPRAAVVSLHARMAGVVPSDWEHPELVQVWGPRFSAYVVHRADQAVFTLGRWPADVGRQEYALDLADRLEAHVAGGAVRYGEAGRALGVHPNQLRYAATTGRVLIRWDGARQPTIRMTRRPEMGPTEARRELLRRYLHVLGPGTAEGFGDWAGLRARSARPAFADLEPELTPVRTPVGDGWILTSDEQSFRSDVVRSDAVRLLPSGDPYYLLHGRQRELLVPDGARRPLLWTSRVWPGAVVVGGDVVGTWRRADRTVTVSLWAAMPDATRAVVEQEASALPVPATRTGSGSDSGSDAAVTVRWETPGAVTAPARGT